MKTTVAYCFWDSQGHLSQTAHGGNFPDNTHFLDLIYFPVSLLYSQATVPGITFQINTLCANSYLRVHFWGNQMKSPFLRILGVFLDIVSQQRSFNSFTPQRGHWIWEIKYIVTIKETPKSLSESTVPIIFITHCLLRVPRPTYLLIIFMPRVLVFVFVSVFEVSFTVVSLGI